MADFTFVELHLHGLDVPDLPFGSTERDSGVDHSSQTPASRQPTRGGSRDGGLRSRIPTRVLVGVVVLLVAIGAVAAVKLRSGGALSDFAEEY